MIEQNTCCFCRTKIDIDEKHFKSDDNIYWCNECDDDERYLNI